MAAAPPEAPLPSLESIAFRQALSAATTVAYLAAFRFQEPNISAALKNERLAEDQRRDIFAEIERLADLDTFQEAKRRLASSPNAQTAPSERKS